MALSNSGAFIVTGQLGSNNSKNYESPLFVWDIKSKKLIKQLPGLKDGIRNIAISKDDSLIAACSTSLSKRRQQEPPDDMEHQDHDDGAQQAI